MKDSEWEAWIDRYSKMTPQEREAAWQPLTPEQRRHVEHLLQAKVQRQPTRTWIGCLIALVGMGLPLLLGLYGIFYESPEHKAARQEEQEARNNDPSGREGAAYAQCKEHVKGRLLAPSTAKFPWGSIDSTKYKGDGTYMVSSYVDAQNGFGAMIRMNYTCTVRADVAADRWHLVDLNIE